LSLTTFVAQCEGSHRIPDYVALLLEPPTSHNLRTSACLSDAAWHASDTSFGNSDSVYRKLKSLFFKILSRESQDYLSIKRRQLSS